MIEPLTIKTIDPYNQVGEKYLGIRYSGISGFKKKKPSHWFKRLDCSREGTWVLMDGYSRPIILFLFAYMHKKRTVKIRLLLQPIKYL